MRRSLSSLRGGFGLLAVVLVALIGGFVLFTVLGVGSRTPSGRAGAAAAPPPPAAVPARSARALYSEDVGRREAGSGNPDQPLNEEVPFSDRDFERPIAAYRRYAAGQVGLLARDARGLRAALAAGDRARARVAWRAAFARDLRLGAVYGQFADADAAVTRALAQVERGLWSGRTPRALVPAAADLALGVRRLGVAVRSEAITPLDYATRAHEVLEDAQRDFLSGTDLGPAGEGVLATESGAYATRELVRTLDRLLAGRDVHEAVDLGLDRLLAELGSLRAAHHGTLPTLAGLSRRERQGLDGAVSFALVRLRTLPDALATSDPPRVIPLPGGTP